MNVDDCNCDMDSNSNLNWKDKAEGKWRNERTGLKGPLKLQAAWGIVGKGSEDIIGRREWRRGGKVLTSG